MSCTKCCIVNDIMFPQFAYIVDPNWEVDLVGGCESIAGGICMHTV